MSTTPEQRSEAKTQDDDERDELDELIAEGTLEDPAFPAMVEAALQERQAARARGEDPNDIPWDDEEIEGEKDTSQPSSAKIH